MSKNIPSFQFLCEISTKMSKLPFLPCLLLCIVIISLKNEWNSSVIRSKYGWRLRHTCLATEKALRNYKVAKRVTYFHIKLETKLCFSLFFLTSEWNILEFTK